MVLRNSALVVLATAVVGVSLLSGCEGSTNTRALFTKPDLLRYERYAVLGLDPEQEQIFMAAYVRTFSERIITFVERARLTDIISEQDLLRGRLNDRTRARIQHILGVEALVMCDYSQEEGGRQKKFRVRIVDSETGAIVGSVLVAAYSSFDEHARQVTEALKADLLSGAYRGYYRPASVPEGGAP